MYPRRRLELEELLEIGQVGCLEYLFLCCMVLAFKPWVLHMLGKCSLTELCSQPMSEVLRDLPSTLSSTDLGPRSHSTLPVTQDPYLEEQRDRR